MKQIKHKEYSINDTTQIISRLPKFLYSKKTDERYILTMIKTDWDYSQVNSYIVRYAHFNLRSISRRKILLETCGITFDKAVYNMYLKITELENTGQKQGGYLIDDQISTKRKVQKTDKNISFSSMPQHYL